MSKKGREGEIEIERQIDREALRVSKKGREGEIETE